MRPNVRNARGLVLSLTVQVVLHVSAARFQRSARGVRCSTLLRPAISIWCCRSVGAAGCATGDDVCRLPIRCTGAPDSAGPLGGSFQRFKHMNSLASHRPPPGSYWTPYIAARGSGLGALGAGSVARPRFRPTEALALAPCVVLYAAEPNVAQCR